jgi:soluble lytic murein transglycosylase-like protein
MILILALTLISPILSAAARTELKTKYDPMIQKIAARHAVNPSLVHSIIAAESDYDRFAVSKKGALGLMQLMPDTAAAYGVRDVFNPEANIEGGVKFLRDMLEEFDNKLDLALAAYNAGHKAVKKYDGVPPYPETKKYVQEVKRNLRLETLSKKTKIYEYRDKQGRVVITNDARLALGSD